MRTHTCQHSLLRAFVYADFLRDVCNGTDTAVVVNTATFVGNIPAGAAGGGLSVVQCLCLTTDSKETAQMVSQNKVHWEARGHSDKQVVSINSTN